MNNWFRLLAKSHYNSNYISFRLRRFFEKTSIRKVIGIQLTSTMFLAGIIVPQVQLISANITTNSKTTPTIVSQSTITEVTYTWPLNNYQVSQKYQFYHPGLDLTAPYEDSVMSIAKGKVESTTTSNWGYGKYVVVRHENGYASLYAHLAEILVKTDDEVDKNTVIGKVGTTGWSTGSHLHLEIHGPDGTINPLEILPAIKVE
ncbi:M23 family metallopeptidase [Candidatus Gottesmanbacteria bacterium]|nr:M23 family metallopeptidase [Candidatus Gottesmanbacteria bacterium]